MSVTQTQKRPMFLNTGRVAKSVGRPRQIIDALTTLSGAECVPAGRCRMYTPDNQILIEKAAEVYDLAEGLDMTGRAELREAWEEFAEKARQIAERQRAMIEPVTAV